MKKENEEKYSNFKLLEMYSDYGDVTGIQTIRRFIDHINLHFGKLNESVQEFLRFYNEIVKVDDELNAFINAWNTMNENNEQFILDVETQLNDWGVVFDVKLEKKLDVTSFETYKNQMVASLLTKADKTVTDALQTNKADKTVTDALQTNKADKTVTDTLQTNKVDKSFIPFHTVKRLSGETNDDLAFDRMNAYFASNGGGVAYLEAREYSITRTIKITTNGVHLEGVVQRTTIKPTNTFNSGADKAIIFVKQGDNVPMKGIVLKNFRIHANNADGSALKTHVLYDNILIENIDTEWANRNHPIYLFEGSTRPSQTGIVNNVIGNFDIGNSSTKPVFNLVKIQEWVFNNCKAFSGEYSNNVHLTNTYGFIIDSCRGVTLNACSTVNRVGYQIIARNDFPVRGISINNPRLESITWSSLVTTIVNGGTIEEIYFINPNTFGNLGSIQLNNVKNSTIDARMMDVGVSSSEKNIITVNKFEQITYLGNKNNDIRVVHKDWKQVTLMNGWTGTLWYRIIDNLKIEFKGEVVGTDATSAYIAVIPKLNQTMASYGFTNAVVQGKWGVFGISLAKSPSGPDSNMSINLPEISQTTVSKANLYGIEMTIE